MKLKTHRVGGAGGGHGWLEEFFAFADIVGAHERPVILGEGRRDLPGGEFEKIREVAQWLAVRFPRLILRTGNAPGADEAFAAGFGAVDPARIEFILPVAGHRKGVRHPDSRSVSIADVGRVAEEALADATVSATPSYERVVGLRYKIPRLRAKANYLLRDTLKVVGTKQDETSSPGRPALDPPVAALFWADPADPMTGGTGHTIRVCLAQHIPTALQHHWLGWKKGSYEILLNLR